MSALLFCLLLLVGWLVPDHFPPWKGFQNEAPAFAALLVAACYQAAQSYRTATTQQISGLASLWIVSLLTLVWLQWFTGLVALAGDAFVATAYLLGFGIAWQIGAKAAATEAGKKEWLTPLAGTFVLGAVLSSWIALLQWFELEGMMVPWVMSAAHTTRALGNLAQPNQLATLLLMGTVATMMLYQWERISGFLATLLVAVMSMGVVLTQSRTALVSAGCLLALRYLIPHASGPIRIHKSAVWAWVICLLAMTAVLHGFADEMHAKGDLRGEIATVGLRPLMWKQLLAGLAESPWLGYGWLQTGAAQQQGAMLVAGLEQTNYAHNLMLDLMVWCGIPIGIGIIVVGIRWLMVRWLRVRSATGVLLFAWLLPVGVHSMLEFPFAYAYLLFPAGILLGMIDSATENSETVATISGRTMRWLVGLMLLVYSLLVPALGWEYQKIEEDFRVARFENRRIGQTPVDYSVPELHLLTQWGTVLRAMRLRAEPGMSPSDLLTLRLASQRFSWGALHFRYAMALALNGQPEQAAMQMQLIKNMFGPEMYEEARNDFLRMKKEKYPELARVKLP